MEADQAKSSNGGRRAVTFAVVVTLINAAVLVAFFVVPALRDDTEQPLVSGSSLSPVSSDEPTSSVVPTDSNVEATTPPAVTQSDDVEPATAEASSTSTTSTTSTTAPVELGADTTPGEDEAADGTDEPLVSTTEGQSDTGPSYPTLPDGRPVPLQAIYNGDDVVVAGPVPDEAARERLVALALANSKSPNPEIIDFLTIDPTVPITIGVRVTELESTRFPATSSEITPEHALELDRVVAIMTALPEITVEVLGHADQRGPEEQNYAISSDRAQAVADYLSLNGISPLRVSSRPVGEAELLSRERTEDAFALNRRTEFIFYGLLGE